MALLLFGVPFGHRTGLLGLLDDRAVWNTKPSNPVRSTRPVWASSAGLRRTLPARPLASTTQVSDHTGAVIQDTLLYPWGPAADVLRLGERTHNARAGAEFSRLCEATVFNVRSCLVLPAPATATHPHCQKLYTSYQESRDL
jgi:hypothetical protein